MIEKPATKTIGIVDLLKLRGFDPDRPTKLVRHVDVPKYNVVLDELMRREGWFEYFQATQSHPRFDGCERIVSFIGTEGTRARFVGVYRVNGRSDDRRQCPGPRGFSPTYAEGERYFYDLEREAGYEDLENRVVIDWGKGTLSWVQKLSNKEVFEILPTGRLLPPFRDYLEFTLTHDELKDLFARVEAHQDWRDHLSAVAGVYLILATTTGKQYVGSAYGVDGIWGRWAAYAHNGHGGNRHLKKLVKSDPAYPAAFLYSILQILPKSYAKDVVLAHEQMYMKKLGTRATGLNWQPGLREPHTPSTNSEDEP